MLTLLQAHRDTLAAALPHCDDPKSVSAEPLDESPFNISDVAGLAGVYTSKPPGKKTDRTFEAVGWLHDGRWFTLAAWALDVPSAAVWGSKNAGGSVSVGASRGEAVRSLDAPARKRLGLD